MAQKYAVVTGASSDLGGAIAQALSQNGYHIALAGRSHPKLATLADSIAKRGGTSTIFASDLSKLDGINKLIDEVKKDTTHVDVLINAAAIWHGDNEVFANRDFAAFPQKVVVDTLMVGLTAPTLISHALIPLMPPKSKIINISGVFADLVKGWSPYYVSKRGIEDLTISLATELESRDIQVNAISPNDVATQPYQKYFPQYYSEGIDPNEVANFVIKLCSGEADMATGKVYVIAKDQPVVEQFHA